MKHLINKGLFQRFWIGACILSIPLLTWYYSSYDSKVPKFLGDRKAYLSINTESVPSVPPIKEHSKNEAFKLENNEKASKIKKIVTLLYVMNAKNLNTR